MKDLVSDAMATSITHRGRPFTIIPFEIFTYGIHLSQLAKVVLITLYSFRNTKTGKANPSYPKITNRSGLNRDQIGDGLNELEHFGWISRRKGYQGVNNYKFLIPDHVTPTRHEAKAFKKQLHGGQSRTVIKTTRDEYDEYGNAIIAVVAPVLQYEDIGADEFF